MFVMYMLVFESYMLKGKNMFSSVGSTLIKVKKKIISIVAYAIIKNIYGSNLIASTNLNIENVKRYY